MVYAHGIKRKILFKTCLIVIVFTLLCGILSSCTDYTIYTQDISQYNSKDFPIDQTFFLKEIPSNADAIAFSYYDYWEEDFDLYLELKFKNQQELEDYLTELKNYVINSFESRDIERLFREVINPYDSSYTDLFIMAYITMQGDKMFTGYEIKVSDNSKLFSCNFGVISYSLDDLTVIQSATSGSFENVNKYIPKYFERFNVPLNENYERFIFR